MDARWSCRKRAAFVVARHPEFSFFFSFFFLVHDFSVEHSSALALECVEMIIIRYT